MENKRELCLRISTQAVATINQAIITLKYRLDLYILELHLEI